MDLILNSFHRHVCLFVIMIGLSFIGSHGIVSAAESGKSFDEIMASLSQQGSLSNGDGHRWQFRQKSDGTWEVEGARSETARVSSAGPDAIKIDGFPSNWNANGRFEFSVDDGKCRLKSDHSNHRMKWKC